MPSVSNADWDRLRYYLEARFPDILRNKRVKATQEGASL